METDELVAVVDDWPAELDHPILVTPTSFKPCRRSKDGSRTQALNIETDVTDTAEEGAFS
jgi:hypothetical protein